MKAKDLAKKLGVSPATISLVLNNKPGISDTLRKSLLRQIQDLGYGQMLCESCREGAAPGQQPAPKAPEPYGGGCACKSIAYLIYHEHDYLEDMNDPYNFFSGVLEGIEAEAWEHDYCLIMLHAGRYKKATVEEQLRRAGNVVGVIVHPCTLNEQMAETARALPVPCVFMDAYTDSTWQPPSVCISNSQGMHRAVEHLKSLGHRRIGYVSSGWRSNLNLERHRCFIEAMKELDLKFDPGDLFVGGDEFRPTGPGLAEAFKAGGAAPTALICEGDLQAIKAIRTLQQMGLRVPEDVSVVGFDDSPVCTSVEPAITTIRNSPQLMGRQCVLMLENLLRLKDLGEEPWLRYELPASLVLRSSTGPAPGDK